MKATPAPRHPDHAHKEPFATYFVLSAIMHGAVISCMLGAAWLWGTPAYYKPSFHTVSLVDAPLTFQQTPPASRSKKPPKKQKRAVRRQLVVQAKSASKPPAATRTTKPKRKTTALRTPKPTKTAKAVTLLSKHKKRGAVATSVAKPTKAAKTTAASPKKKKPAAAKQRSPFHTRSTRTQSATATKTQTRVTLPTRKEKTIPDITKAQQRAAEQRLAALRKRFGSRGGGTAVTGATAELLRIRLQTYQEHVREKIIEAWILPMAQEEARDLQAIALLIVDRDGHIAQFELLKPSGNPLFDDSLMRTIQQADPLPALPDDYRGKFLEVEMRFKPYDS